jgi:hypothetical protein
LPPGGSTVDARAGTVIGSLLPPSALGTLPNGDLILTASIFSGELR